MTLNKKVIFFLAFAVIFVSWVSVRSFLVLTEGLPNEFFYNVPWLLEKQGIDWGEDFLLLSRLFQNPIMIVAGWISPSFNFIYGAFAGLNVLIFLFACLHFFPSRTKGLIFFLLFILVNARLMLTGTLSSTFATFLIIGGGLFYRQNRFSDIFNGLAIFIYPLSFVLLYTLSFVKKWERRQYKALGKSLAFAGFFALLWFLVGNHERPDAYYFKYISWSEIAADKLLFGNEMRELARDKSLTALIESILFDNARIGTYLLSWTPESTPRYIYLVTIALAFICGFPLLRYLKEYKWEIASCVAWYVLSFIAAFALYFPARYVLIPTAIFLCYLTVEALYYLAANRGRTYYVAVVTLFAMSFFFYQQRDWVRPNLSAKTYLSYLDEYSQSEDLKALEGFLKLKTTADDIFLASPRLSEVLVMREVRARPYLTYKFLDKSYRLREKTEQLWQIYLSSNESELERRCREEGIKYIIFESELLKLLGQRKWDQVRKNILYPYTQKSAVESLPLIDFKLPLVFERGVFKVYQCQ